MSTSLSSRTPLSLFLSVIKNSQLGLLNIHHAVLLLLLRLFALRPTSLQWVHPKTTPVKKKKKKTGPKQIHTGHVDPRVREKMRQKKKKKKRREEVWVNRKKRGYKNRTRPEEANRRRVGVHFPPVCVRSESRAALHLNNSTVGQMPPASSSPLLLLLLLLLTPCFSDITRPHLIGRLKYAHFSVWHIIAAKNNSAHKHTHTQTQPGGPWEFLQCCSDSQPSVSMRQINTGRDDDSKL